ncbi:hypothetical protein [Bacillus thuringiensis]|uniref:hypothetical protein n=1 Tax=Bacillus thuringiensis TaxID=1428 RepID=UPI0011A6BE9B|nr:hypothetical protein [Bacillus thuringiensis]
MHLSCKDINVPADSRYVPKFHVMDHLEDEENTITYYIYYVTTTLEYTKEDEEIEIPVVVLEGRYEVEYYQLPQELWEWGMEFAKLHIKNPLEAKFSYIEETGLWEVETIAVWHK